MAIELQCKEMMRFLLDTTNVANEAELKQLFKDFFTKSAPHQLWEDCLVTGHIYMSGDHLFHVYATVTWDDNVVKVQSHHPDPVKAITLAVSDLSKRLVFVS